MRIERLGKGTRSEVIQEFDKLDRLIARSVNGEPPESFTYNALGLVTSYRNRAGFETQYLHDAHGRRIGQASVNPNSKGRMSEQMIIHRVELNDNNNIVARITPSGYRTKYSYDALNRRSEVIYPDGNTQKV